MSRKYCFGIDPSLTGAALCAYPVPKEGGPLEGFITRRFTSKPAPTVYDRVSRYRILRNNIMNACAEIGEPEWVFLEGYSFGSSGRGVLDLAEFGGILRVALAAWCPSNFREVAPSTLKQFATSKGNSKKEEVMAHVAHRYGHIFKSNDECDAWVLSRMAAVAAGWCRPDTTFQRTAVAVAKQLVPA